MPAEILAARLHPDHTPQATPEELATLLGVSESEYLRWESGGQLQSRAADKLLRLYFADPKRYKRDVLWPHAPAEEARSVEEPRARPARYVGLGV